MNANYRPTVVDYRAAVGGLCDFELESEGWNLQMKKIEAILAAMLVDPSEHVRCYASGQIEDDLYTLSEFGSSIDDPDAAYLLWLLDTFGFQWRADRVRESWGENAYDQAK